MPTYPVEDFSLRFGSISQFLTCFVRHSPLRINGLTYCMISFTFSKQFNARVDSNSNACFFDSPDLNFGPRTSTWCFFAGVAVLAVALGVIFEIALAVVVFAVLVYCCAF